MTQAQRTELMYHRKALNDTLLYTAQLLEVANHALQTILATNTTANCDDIMSAMTTVEATRIRMYDELRGAYIHLENVRKLTAREKTEETT